jgi:quinol-cytochrome oxidoreductase complex cytochrome b subunit
LLTLIYVPHPLQAFNSVDYINREVNGGAVLHIIHLAGASLFFAMLFIHVARGLMAGRFITPGLWYRGVALLGVAIITAFLGYTLP